MKITINGITYTQIKNLTFAPEADIIGLELPINGFTADIITDVEIDPGVNVYLYDDLNNLWAKYKLIDSVRKDPETLSITAESVLRRLDRRTMNPVVYEDKPLNQILALIFGGISSNDWTTTEAINDKYITGYFPKQTARERLQWICFTCGLFVRSFFYDRVVIKSIDSTVSAVPIEKVFWRPSLGYKDPVTKVQATMYSYVEGEPQNTDKWVQIGNTYYIQTSQEMSLTNPEYPDNEDDNVVSVDDVTIVNPDNISDVLSRMATYYFNRVEVDAEIVNNREFVPGDKIALPITDEDVATGYLKSTDFTFGLQAKSRIKLQQILMSKASQLKIVYMYVNKKLGSQIYMLPRGTNYQIQNPYLDITKGSGKNYKRYIYFPLQQYATGTMSAAKVTDEEDYDRALCHTGKGILIIWSVDSATLTTSSDKRIVEVG